MSNSTKISVIIPTYNRVLQLASCLNALIKQDYKEKFELVIVDDGSTDSTKKVVDSFFKQYQKKVQITYIFQENQGCAVARNTGIQYSQGEYVFFTDDDCIVPCNWITEILKGFEKFPEVVAVGGKIGGQVKKNIYIDAYEKCANLSFDIDFDQYEYKSNNFEKNPCGDTGNICYKKEIFERIGYFDAWTRKTALIDFEFKLRVFYNKMSMLYISNSVYHDKNMDFFDLLKKAFTYGYAKFYLSTRYQNFYNSNLFSNLSLLKNRYPEYRLHYCFAYLFVEKVAKTWANLLKVKSGTYFSLPTLDRIFYQKENIYTKLKEFCIYFSHDFYFNSNDSIRRKFLAINLLKENYQTPLISIIIPFYNRPEYVTEFFIENLNNLVCSDSSVELILVDDGSIDETLLKLQESVSKFRFKTRVLTQVNGGPSSARNLGIRNAQGEYIFMTDSDVAVSQYWLRELLAAFLYNQEIVLVGGGQIQRSPITIFDKWRNSISSKNKKFFVTDSVFWEMGLPYDTANIAIKNNQNLFFDENYKLPGVEDYDFVYHIKKQNKMVAYVPFFVSNLRHMNKNDYENMVHARAVGFKLFLSKTKDNKHYINMYSVLTLIFKGKFNMFKLLNLKNLIAKIID